MRPLTRPGLALVIAVAVIALPTAASGALSAPAATAANETTYQDSTGENGPTAPDIRGIVVSNSDAGVITFRVNVANRSSFGQDLWLDLFVDKDANRATGDPAAGFDYVIQIIQGEASLYRWDGSGFTRRFGDPSAVTLSFTYRDGFTIQISASELGNTRRFGFYMDLISGVQFDPQTQQPFCPEGSVCPEDDAPGGGAGLYAFQVKITPPTLIVKKLTVGKAVAGKPFTVRLVTARSDTGAVVRNGRVTCVLRVGKARLRAQVQAVQGGAATCTWNIGATAKVKTFRGSVTIVFEGLRASQSFTGKVR